MANRNQVAEPEGTFDAFAGTPDLPDFEPEQVREKISDPRMDPGHAKWMPKEYFARQPKVTITIMRTESDILSDPRGERVITVPVSINGYRLDIKKGVATRVPKDFADHLVDIGAAVRQSDIEEPTEV